MRYKMIVRMIAVVTVFLMLMSIGIMFVGCGNQAVFDTTWTFERAIIFLPDGNKIEGRVSSWTEFDSSDMIQVTIEGKTYLTHSTNVILISE